MHGVSLSIGSTDPLNFDYLTRLKRLADAIHPQWISDHVCWTGVCDRNTHDLLPLPSTKKPLLTSCSGFAPFRSFLERRIVLEKPQLLRPPSPTQQ